MKIEELFLLAITALKGNVIRTLLTMLGIVIGIASVILIISLGQGSTKSIVDQISAFGANLLTISPGKARGFGSSSGATTLILGDGEAILKLSNIEAVSGVVSGNKTISYDGNNVGTNITGVEASYEIVHSIELLNGSFITDSNINTMSKVTVMGTEISDELFGEEFDAVGQTVRIDGKTFRIIGSIDSSSNVLVPLSTASKILFGRDDLNSISVKVEDNSIIGQTEEEVETLLLTRHKITNPDNADFNIRNFQDMIDSISNVTGTMTTLLSGIAAISLVVGGIGIMNIMLVTVTERTKEIGLLKAIGAKKKDILTQFLIESLVLTLVGGLIGIVLGLAIAYFAANAMSIPFVISLSGILLAVGVSSAIGIGFGYYPAKKASDLQPIDALRYE
jgi:putative ABC transport system permease protein